MKKLLLLILFVLNLVLLQAQKVEFISVNNADTTLENVNFKTLQKHLSKDSLTADTLATPAKWMLKLNKKLSKEQRQDSNIYIFFCPTSKDSLKAFLPLSGKYGYVLFDTAKTGVVELERLQKRLSTRKYQWDLIHDPETMLFAFLQDESEGALIYEPIVLSFTDKSHKINEIFKDRTEITYVTPGGRFLTLPIAFKPNFTGSFVKTKSNEKIMPRMPDGVLLSFFDASGAYWGAHMSEKDGDYYFDGYRKKVDDAYTDEYYKENLSSKLGTSAEVLLGFDPGCDLELYFTTCGVLRKAEADNKGDDRVPDALDIGSLGEPDYIVSETTHNKSCLGEIGLKFYNEQAENVTDEAVLNKIFSVAKLIDKCGDRLYGDYKTFSGKTNSNYWDEGVWKPEEQYEIFEKALTAYTKGKDELEQLLVLYEDNKDKFTAIAWMLVEKYYASIAVDTRHYILKKLSESAMYGNMWFGNGQEYLALRLIKTVPTIEEAKELVSLLKKNNTLQNLYKNIDDEGGPDNFTSFIVVLSSYALNDANPTANADNIYTWDDSFLKRSDINYRLGFQEDGNLYINIYNTEYQYTPSATGGSYTPVKILDTEKSLKDIDPFTWVPVRYRGKSEYIPAMGTTIGNVTFVPAIYLMALQTKHVTAVTKATIKTAVNVGSIFLGVGAIQAATTAVKVVIAIDAIAATVDIAVTWSENDIKKLDGGDKFLKGYSIFSAALGVATFSAENIIKGSVRSTHSVTDFLEGWNSMCKKYSTNAESCKQLVNAIGIDNFKKIEANANIALDILRKEGVDVGDFEKVGDFQATIAKNADIIGDVADDLLSQLDEILDGVKNFDDNALDIADAGLANWKTFQNQVTTQLTNSGKRVGSQISLDVYIKGKDAPVRIIVDDLVEVEPGVFKIIDAKTSKVKNLTEESSLLNTCTKNQKEVYPLIDEFGSSGDIEKIVPKGANVGKSGLIDILDRPIQVQKGVDFYVNGSFDDFTKYAVRKMTK